jgi:cytochrome P450
MQSFFHLVLQHRLVYDRIVSELEDHQISGNLTSDLITYAQAQQLPYFQAALTETMRLRPAVGVNISRKAPHDGVTIQGRQFSAHTRFAINAWAVHRDHEVFGEDAGLFRPERWLEGDHERIRVMRKHLYQVGYSAMTERLPLDLTYLFLQFGAGSHVCLGRNLALIEMNRILPQLLREFEMELVDPARELQTEAVFFVIQSGLEVRINRRGDQSMP